MAKQHGKNGKIVFETIDEMKKKVIVVGAGGHAKVVADALLCSGEFELLGFADDNVAIGTKILENHEVISTIDGFLSWKNNVDFLALGIGNLVVRSKLVNQLSNDFKWTAVIHPSAVVATSAILGEGVTILANAVVASQAEIEAFAIIDAGVIVDHECRIGKYTHLCIGSLIGSNSSISDNYKTELGQIVPPFSKI